MLVNKKTLSEKMKSFFISALLIAFVLVLFCQSGSAVKCYKCARGPCKKTVTCPAGKDACIAVNLGTKNVFDCWKYSECNLDKVGAYYKSQSFGFRCCTGYLCNAKAYTNSG
ncbi:CD59 glycoprotein-like isoform X1 [Anolis sagrei]|uniref:CD59 glycoprotein-like isoform X1 n=2 Tax=Anolis sagrei TaxID=38937 RepID=UPI003521A424